MGSELNSQMERMNYISKASHELMNRIEGSKPTVAYLLRCGQNSVCTIC